MYAAGQPTRAIADALGVTQYCVQYHLRDAGTNLTADTRARHRAEKAKFAAVWNAAPTADDAAKSLGLSPVQAVCKAYKLRTRHGLWLKRMPKRPRAPYAARLRDRVEALIRRGLPNREVIRQSGASQPYVVLIRRRLGIRHARGDQPAAPPRQAD